MSENTMKAFSWSTAIDETFQEISQQAVNYAPQLAGALALLLAGVLIAHFLKLATKKLVQGLDFLFKRTDKVDGYKRERLKRSYSVITSQIVFWAVLMFFIAASANLLGWKMFTGWMDSLIVFLPSLITGLLIILAGFLLGNAARSGILSTAASADITQGPLLAKIAQIFILCSSIIIGVEQVGLNVHFLTTIIVVTIGLLLAGATLAFGLGARTFVENILGAQNIRKHARIGEHMYIGDHDGEILEVTQTSIILDTATGRVVVPAKMFQEQVSRLSNDFITAPPEQQTESQEVEDE
ncbi:mechanosensitive ion channel family protein [Emcibacter sp.]|uniref:mechanosensitive ion channel family protein n=1 Tax=Emcibacter sp. TaxID=1979954 RepID=UPI003A9007AB